MEKLSVALEDHKFFGIICSKLHMIKDDFITAYIEQLIKLLNTSKIEMPMLKSIIGMGVLEYEPSLRSLCWKLLFEYLPLNSLNWEDIIDKKRMEYNELKRKYIISINSKKKKGHDHPLSANSEWEGYFKDTQLGKIIEKDLKRTRNEVPFFTEKSKANKKETNLDVLKRILLIFAKKYPDICYVQGLNEILATIYYCFSQDRNPYFSLEAESDSFFCFEHLICLTKDIYIQSNDSSPTGIKTRLNYITYLLQIIDYEMFANFKSKNLELSTIAFRWYTLYFAQEFSIKGAMKMYDHILIRENIYQTLTLLCLSALKIKRTELLSKDLGIVMNALQTFSEDDISKMFEKAREVDEILKSHKEVDFDSFIKTHKTKDFEIIDF